MTSSSIRKHAGAGPASDQPTVPEPAFAERARTLMYLGCIGSLSTLSRKQPGFPFGSVMPYGLDDHGRPIFLISTMAMHTQNLQADPRASLLVTQDDTGGDPLGASRVTLVGNVLPTEPETNPVPFTVSVIPATPGLMASGTSGWLIKGTGLAVTGDTNLKRP